MTRISGDTLRMIYGFCLLFILAFLAARIALGNVQEASSYGLVPLLTTLSTLAGAFAQWAFSSKGKDDAKPVVTAPANESKE
jgi:hypothetical protein